MTHAPESRRADGPVGREREADALGAFLEPGSGTVAALIEGEAGIGKTTVWRAGTALAEQHGFGVLKAAPAGEEAAMTWAGLADLLAAVFDGVAESLPAPQREALAVALLQVAPRGHGPDARAVATALLSALRELSGPRPLLVAIDDVQWLDEATSAALRFAAGRLGRAPVRFLLARRGVDDAIPFDLARAGPVLRLPLAPLSLGALHRVLVEATGTAYRRPQLVRVHHTSRGNPLYAIELARTLDPVVAPPTLEELPIAATLEELVEARVSRLPAATRRLLLAAALAPQLELDALAAAADAGDADSAVAPALEAGLVRVIRASVVFQHPLFRATIAGGASPLRARLHARLADLAPTVEERARHLASAHGRPNASVAAELAAAAAEVRARGAAGAAGDLLLIAAEFTPPDARALRRERLLTASRQLYEGGDLERARAAAEGAVDASTDDRERAEALLEFTRVAHEDLPSAIRLREQALAHAGGDTDLVAEAATRLSAAHTMSGDGGTGLHYAELARSLEPDVQSDEIRARALAQVGVVQLITAGRAEPGVLERSVEIEERLGETGSYMGRVWLSVQLRCSGDFDGARAVLEALLPERESEATVARAIDALDYLTQLEVTAGHLDDACAHADRALAYSDQFGVERLRAKVLAARALAYGIAGDAETARTAASEGLAAAEERGHTLYASRNRCALGAVALAAGDARGAAATLRPLSADVAAMGDAEPGLLPFEADLAEALVDAGELEPAKAVVESLEARSARFGSFYGAVVAARSAAIVAAAAGDFDAAASHFERALAAQERFAAPVERARTLLAWGAAKRRARQKRDAREMLESAAAVFDDVGARLWLGRTKDELARIGGRARATSGLTPTEQRVSELVAQGRSNKEVAALLHVTIRTVETHLTNVYAKLGVRSRTELSYRLGRP